MGRRLFVFTDGSISQASCGNACNRVAAGLAALTFHDSPALPSVWVPAGDRSRRAAKSCRDAVAGRVARAARCSAQGCFGAGACVRGDAVRGGQFPRADDAREQLRANGMRVRAWDFFYALFGFVVTSFVRIAGVLLIFSATSSCPQSAPCCSRARYGSGCSSAASSRSSAASAASAE